MNRLLIFAALASFLAMYATLQSPQAVQACSLVPLTPESLPDLVERTAIIAVGTWTSTSEGEATLTVTEALKGARIGADLEVDNRQGRLGADCSSYNDSFQDGYRFSEGQRSVVFLEKEVDGLWQVGYFSFAAFDVPENDAVPLSGPGRDPSVNMFSLSDLRAATIDDRAGVPAEAATPGSAVDPALDEDAPDGGGVALDEDAPDGAVAPAESATPGSAVEPSFDEGAADSGVTLLGRIALLAAAAAAVAFGIGLLVAAVAFGIAVWTRRRRQSWR